MVGAAADDGFGRLENCLNHHRCCAGLILTVCVHIRTASAASAASDSPEPRPVSLAETKIWSHQRWRQRLGGIAPRSLLLFNSAAGTVAATAGCPPRAVAAAKPFCFPASGRSQAGAVSATRLAWTAPATRGLAKLTQPPILNSPMR